MIEKELPNVLFKLGIPKKLSNILALTSIALLKAKSPSIRALADYLPLPYNKQVKTNKIWRLFNKSKLFKPKSSMNSLFLLSRNLSKSNYIIIDFTSLDGYDIKLFIASITFKGRSLPFYCNPLFLKDIHNLKYKSENEFIISSIEELLSIIPKDLRSQIIILGDRQFGTKAFLEFYREKGIHFMVRIRKDINIKIGEKVYKSGELKKGKYIGEIEGREYFIYVREDKKEKLILVTDIESRDSLKACMKYLKRSQCEQMHRDLKSKMELLFLKSKYHKRLEDEKIKKYLVVFMLAEIIGIWIGKIVDRSEHRKKFISRKGEKSLFNLGQIIINRIYEFSDIVLRFKLSAVKLFFFNSFPFI